MGAQIRPLEIADYDAVRDLWKDSEGLGLSSADSLDGTRQYLERNPGLSFVAFDRERCAGVVLCGHDGRRGYIHHLAVSQEQRRNGLGRRLVEHSLEALAAGGIAKCHLFILPENPGGVAFWRSIGRVRRDELTLWSLYTTPRAPGA